MQNKTGICLLPILKYCHHRFYFTPQTYDIKYALSNSNENAYLIRNSPNSTTSKNMDNVRRIRSSGFTRFAKSHDLRPGSFKSFFVTVIS